MAEFQGSRFVNPVPGVTLGCITPEARDLLDRVMDAYREHYNPEAHTASPDEVYQFAYWLIRWSGLVQPTSQEPTEDFAHAPRT